VSEITIMGRRRKVLHLIDTTGPGGAETVFYELASRIDSNRYKSVVLIRGAGWLKSNLEKKGFEPIIINSKGSFNLRFLFSLIRIIKNEKVDVIHSHLLGSNVYASVAGFLSGAPVITTFHGKTDISDNERFLTLKFSLINLLAKEIVFVSERLLCDVAAKIKVNAKKAKVVFNGVNPPLGISDRASARKQFGFTEGRVVLGALGNIRAAKNYQLFVDAVAELLERGLDVEAVIAGSGEGALEDSLKARVKELGLEDRFKLLGFVENTSDYLAAIDCYIISSTSEGHPLALTQAMMAGLPIVATRCGVEEIIGSDEGQVVEINVAAFSQAIERVVNDYEAYYSKGKRAKVKAMNNFTMDKMINSYEELYGSY
jgi:glycosyltransferase involved in cell wall biosynthesis